MVEEADPGRDARAAAAVEVEQDPQRRLGARARDERASAPARAGGGAERLEHDVVLRRPSQRDPDPVRERRGRRGRPPRAARRAARRCGRRRSCRAPRGSRDRRRASARRTRSRSAMVASTSSSRLPQRRRRDPRGGRGHARRGAAQLELRRGLRRRDRVADAQRGEAERLRERSQHDQVRLLGDQRHAGGAGELEVRLVDDDGRVRVLARDRRDLVHDRAARRSGCSGCRPRSGRRRPAPSTTSAPSSCDDDPVEPYVGGEIAARRPGREVRLRAERDQLVRAGADDDLLGLDAAVRRGRRAELAVACRPGTRSAARSSAASGTCGTPGSGGVFWSKRRTCSGRSPCRVGDLGGRGRPGVRPVVLRQRVRLHRASSAAACSGSPSTRASGSAISRARSSQSAPRRTGSA